MSEPRRELDRVYMRGFGNFTAGPVARPYAPNFADAPMGVFRSNGPTMKAPNGESVFYLYRPKLGTSNTWAFLCPPCNGIVVLLPSSTTEYQIERAIETHEAYHGIGIISGGVLWPRNGW